MPQFSSFIPSKVSTNTNKPFSCKHRIMSSSSSSSRLSLTLFLALSLLLHRSQGEIVCEDLQTDVCAFAIASSGKRCLLENYEAKIGGGVVYQCRTSEVVVGTMAEYIETDQCVSACGVDRNTVGISSDALLEPQSTARLCSPACYQNCPNIIELYFNLAAGEGVFLPDLCERQRSNPRRVMSELLSSGAARAPVSGEAANMVAPASSPAPAPLF